MSESDQPSTLDEAREALVKAINVAKQSPAHESCIYTYGPFADWLQAVSPSETTASLHLRQAAETLASRLRMVGKRKDLRELALFVVQLAMDEAPAPQPANV